MLVRIERYRTCQSSWSARLPVSWWSTCRPPFFCHKATWVSTTSLNRNCCITRAVWCFASCQSWRRGCLDPLRFNGSLWLCRPRHPVTAPADVALQWYARSLTVIVLMCGEPQGSVLGPILFIMYTADLVSLSVIENHGLSPHYTCTSTDDTQVYGLCRPAAVDDFSSKISECVGAVSSWMKLNYDKTEVLWCASGRLVDVSSINCHETLG